MIMKAQMFNYQIWINETDPIKIKQRCEFALKTAGFGVLNISEHYFEPHGYTCLWLLSESHLAVHTFPEEQSTYIELASCVKTQFDKFIDLI